jgi:hypothetical protein
MNNAYASNGLSEEILIVNYREALILRVVTLETKLTERNVAQVTKRGRRGWRPTVQQ